MNPQKQKQILLLAAAVFIVVTVFLILLSLQAKGGVKVTLAAQPSDSTITVDGGEVSAGEYTLAKGAHTIKATRQYFTDAVKKVNTADLKDGQVITLMPSPDSPEALQWLLEHPDVQMEREAAAGAQAAELKQSINEKYPVLKNLPYETLRYKISYSMDGQNVSFQVTLYPLNGSDRDLYKQTLKEYKQQALDYLENQGVNTKTTTITFTPTE